MKEDKSYVGPNGEVLELDEEFFWRHKAEAVDMPFEGESGRPSRQKQRSSAGGSDAVTGARTLVAAADDTD